MACPAKAFGDRLTAADLFDVCFDFQIGDRGAAQAHLVESGDSNPADQTQNDDQHACRHRAGPSDESALGAPGAEAEPCQQDRGSNQNR